MTPFHGRAQQTNLEYLLMLDVDRLIWNFRKVAGLDAPGDPYGRWETPKEELRGHFVGHHLSATAYTWASTHNETLKAKMSALVSALSDCQQKIGTGYLSAFPTSFLDRFEALQSIWALLHHSQGEKSDTLIEIICLGSTFSFEYLTDYSWSGGSIQLYKSAGNSQALKMATWMADYFYGRVRNVIKKYSIELHWRSINEETGSMNDILYQLYSITVGLTLIRLAKNQIQISIKLCVIDSLLDSAGRF